MESQDSRALDPINPVLGLSTLLSLHRHFFLRCPNKEWAGRMNVRVSMRNARRVEDRQRGCTIEPGMRGLRREIGSDTDFLPFDMDVGSSSSPMVPNVERGEVDVDPRGVSNLLIMDD